MWAKHKTTLRVEGGWLGTLVEEEGKKDGWLKRGRSERYGNMVVVTWKIRCFLFKDLLELGNRYS